MRLVVLMLSLLFAQSIAADGSTSATIFLSVSLDAVETPDTRASRDACDSESLCEQTTTDYSIEETNGQLRVTVKPVVRVTVTPI